MSITFLALYCMLVAYSPETTIAHTTGGASGQLQVECRFPTLEYYTCAPEFASIPDIFLDSVSNNNEDQNYFEAIGGKINNACGDVIITAEKTPNMPSSCQDSFMVFLDYTIRDDSSTVFCRRTLITLRPPIVVMDEAADIVVSCEQNVDSIYQEWLTNVGYSTHRICYGTVDVNTAPSEPEINYTCPGTGESTVRFRLKDGCHNYAYTEASFFVVDTIAPTIFCPPDATFELHYESLIVDIDTLLNCATALDNCSATIIQNNFSQSLIDYNCDPVQIIPLEFNATDECGNSSTCVNQISLINHIPPILECPEYLTVQCGETHMDSLVDNWLMSATANDFYGEDVQINVSMNASALDSISCDTILDIQFSAVDICGKTSYCHSLLTVVDTIAPSVVNCPEILIIPSNADKQDMIVEEWLASFTGEDMCSDVITSNNLNSQLLLFDCQDTSVFAVDFTVLDACLNSSYCNSAIKLVNNLNAEIICPVPLILDCGDTDNDLLITQWLNTALGSDNHGNNYQLDNNLQLDFGSILNCFIERQIQFSYKDMCNTQHTCFTTITIRDDTDPDITCPADTTLTNHYDQLESVINDIVTGVTATDNCRLPWVDHNFRNVDLQNCEEEWDLKIDFTAKDSCSMIAKCSTVIGITTNKTPVIECPQPLDIVCGDENNPEILASWLGSGMASDFLGSALVLNSDFNVEDIDTLNCGEQLIVSFSAEDFCQRASTCQATITRNDTIPPEILCPDNLDINSADLEYQQKISDWLKTVSGYDACSQISFSNNLPDSLNLCHLTEDIIVEFSATDVCGLQSSCSSLIKVSHALPQIICPTPLLLECGDSFNQFVDDWIGEAEAWDNADNILPVNSNLDTGLFVANCDFELKVQFSTIDGCGAERICQTSILISDTASPIIDCPISLNLLATNVSDISTINDWLSSPIVTDCNAFEVTDNLNLADIEIPCEGDKDIPVRFIATDDCGNTSACSSTITVTNDILAQIVCPAVLEVQCGDVGINNKVADWLDEVSVSDNAGNTFEVTDNFEFGMLENISCSEDISVRFFTLDYCKDTIQCTSTIHFRDTIPPSIECPSSDSFIIENQSLTHDINQWLLSYVADDNCHIKDVTHDFVLADHLPTCADSLLIDIEFIVEDRCGLNSLCQTSLKLTSQNYPSIVCESPLHVRCGASTLETDVEEWIARFSATDYFGESLEISHNFNIEKLQALTCGEQLEVIFIVTDNCQRSTNCISRIMVEDDEAPEIICPPDITLNALNPNNMQLLELWYDAYSASDNCTDTRMMSNENFSAFKFCDMDEPYDVEFVITDDCNNSSSCTSRVIVFNNKPFIDCPAPLTIECGDASNDNHIFSWLASAKSYDNAGSDLQVMNSFDSSIGLLACDSGVEISFMSLDSCGQESTCKSTLYITDQLPPEIICPENITFEVNLTPDNILSDWIKSVAAFDQCGDVVINHDFELPIENVVCEEDVIVNFVATDQCNLQSSCNASIRIMQYYALDILCPSPIEVVCESQSIYNQLENYFTDFEVIADLAYMVYVSPELSEIDINCQTGYSQSIEFEVEDECGNIDICSSTIIFKPSASVYIPNVFSPNQDGRNDFFTVFANESIVVVKEILIYDRWGNLVFNKRNLQPNDESQGWDGTLEGKPLEDGVYTYFITVTDIESSDLTYSGTITLFK